MTLFIVPIFLSFFFFFLFFSFFLSFFFFSFSGGGGERRPPAPGGGGGGGDGPQPPQMTPLLLKVYLVVLSIFILRPTQICDDPLNLYMVVVPLVSTRIKAGSRQSLTWSGREFRFYIYHVSWVRLNLAGSCWINHDRHKNVWYRYNWLTSEEYDFPILEPLVYRINSVQILREASPEFGNFHRVAVHQLARFVKSPEPLNKYEENDICYRNYNIPTNCSLNINRSQWCYIRCVLWYCRRGAGGGGATSGRRRAPVRVPRLPTFW